jgi:hypothetical protein
VRRLARLSEERRTDRKAGFWLPALSLKNHCDSRRIELGYVIRFEDQQRRSFIF